MDPERIKAFLKKPPVIVALVIVGLVLIGVLGGGVDENDQSEKPKAAAKSKTKKQDKKTVPEDRLTAKENREVSFARAAIKGHCQIALEEGTLPTHRIDGLLKATETIERLAKEKPRARWKPLNPKEFKGRHIFTMRWVKDDVDGILAVGGCIEIVRDSA